MTDSSTRKEARRARRQEESRARTVALLEELCRQNERYLLSYTFIGISSFSWRGV